jgi:hypothetical protein
MSVLNEEKLLPGLLANISPHVDEIVIVDGGPDGPSTDKTKLIAKSCDKVLYTSGKYATLDGAWDMATQKNTGISAASGDVLFFLSADMYFQNLEHLRGIVENDQHKIVFCTTLEFWIDTKHLRLYSADTDVLTVPSSILQAIAIDASYAPYCEEDGSFQIDGVVFSERVLAPQIIKYHLGWIRPFGKQVQKHICHTKQHRWGPDGEKRLRGGERGLEQWAIQHAKSYEGIPCIAFSGDLPPEVEEHADMRYDDGIKAVLDEFERRFGISPFRNKEPE